METIEKLSGQGWHISTDGLNVITNNGAIKDLKAIIDNALDADIKDIGKPILASELNKNKLHVVLQIQKIRNIAAPKSNEDSQAAPRMLKLTLTDGHTYCQGIEIGNISFLSQSKTPPGSKILVKGATVLSGYIFLQPSTCNLLGGKVALLYEKWELSKSISKYTRGSYDGDGPPPWVNFGQKILSSIDSQAFKSLDNKFKEQGKQNSEFEVQRKDAIAEATSGAVRKIFGGGVKQSIQLQDNRKANFNKNYQERERVNGRKWRDVKSEEKPQKPSEKVSLFDFLEDKLGSADVGNSNRSYLQSKNEYTSNNDSYGIKENSQNRAPRFQNTNSTNYSFNTNIKNKPSSKFNANNAYNVSYNQNNNTSNNFQHVPQSKQPRDSFNQSQNLSRNSSASSQNAPTVNSINSSLERMSLNSQFASRSLKQHLNLSGMRPTDVSSNREAAINMSTRRSNNHDNKDSAISLNTWHWKIGDLCMAKYWEDNKYYNATVTATTNRTCVVQFTEYGNYEEVLHCDCIPITAGSNQDIVNTDTNFGGSVEFRRGGNRPYVNSKNFYKPRYDK